MSDVSASPASTFQILPLGDAALTIEFGQDISPALNGQVVAFAEAVRAQRWDGLLDIVPTYRSVTIHINPLRVNMARLTDRLRRIAYTLPHPLPSGRRHRIPVLYGGDVGPDLEDLAAFARLSVAEVIRLHRSVVYRVYMLGFSPGFPYLGSVPEPLAMPRLATPRLTVPAGSVGIAGRQTGIYPTSTPGGWRLIGRTPIALYRPAGPEPFLLHPGDSVRFISITRREFDRFSRTDHADAH